MPKVPHHSITYMDSNGNDCPSGIAHAIKVIVQLPGVESEFQVYYATEYDTLFYA